MSAERLLERFLRYVRVDTTANDAGKSYPSSPGQLELGRILAAELRSMGAGEVEQTDRGLVYATIPAHAQCLSAPVAALNAHVDTSPETTGKNVQPQVIRNYAGGDITLPGDPRQVIRVAANPELQTLLGCTLVTTDGTTLLGSDDKSGVAVIMEFAERLLETKSAHGKIRILFTCDEEIGHGVDHVDLAKLGADVCYTLDGSGAGEIDVETFSADMAVATVRGVNIHPSIGKGRMVNAVRVAAALIDRLPREGFSPETTSEREGFLHPYLIEGGVAEVKVKILLRDFDTAGLATKAELIRAKAAECVALFPGSSIEVNVIKQYRNLGDGLQREPRAVALAAEANRLAGREPRLSIVRGGTDGSQLTERGLPTPNLSTGEHNPHSPLEWTCLEEMEQAVQVLLKLAELWGRESKKSSPQG